jgi:DNA modification methylase
MISEATLNLWVEPQPRYVPDDWTFNGALTRELTHCYHDYPARMIPQIAGKLLDLFAKDATILFDPYSGSGTSLVEGFVRGINVIGTDLNPLARLIAQAKTSVPNPRDIDRLIIEFNNYIKTNPNNASEVTEITGVSRLDFWFKPIVIRKLSALKNFVDKIDNTAVRLFFQVAFSETVRESSNTRNEEFKLYRYEARRLEKFDPDVYGIMLSKIKRNREGLEQLLITLKKLENRGRANIYDFNTVAGIPKGTVAQESIDIVITSPPYGDSHTTVAYGQYSRLSAAWLGLNEPDKIDNKLMGGKVNKEQADLPSKALNKAICQINEIDKKRALEVSAFYSDLYNSISHVSSLVRKSGYACYVVGNRKVKGVTLPTDTAVIDFFQQYGFEHIDTFHRSIPNKRMPLRNSPSNAIGVVEDTMNREYIVVMQRKL